MPKEAFLSLLNKSQKWPKIVKKLRLTPYFTRFGGPFFKVNFLENNTYNESQTKLTTLYKA